MSLAQALLGNPPRRLVQADAELIFYDGQYLLHYMEDGQERYKLLTGAALRAAFSGQAVDSGWLPQGIVRWGEGTHGVYAVKWITPGLYSLAIEVAAGEEGKLKTKRIEVPLPGLVFIGMGTSYYLFALKGDKLDPKAHVFKAPLSNVYTSSLICWGENKPPAASAESMAAAWELFIGSPFNDHLANGKSVAHPEDIGQQLMQIAHQKAKKYPEKDLVPYTYLYSKSGHGDGRITLDEVVNRLAAGELAVAR
jgi:PRTRC genetic system protein B